MRRTSIVLRWVLVGAGLLVAATACRTDQLAFRADEPVAIDQPASMSTHSLPMVVSWRTTTSIANAHRATAQKPLFAVFVDQQPMPVGATVAWVARDDTGCTPPGCPDVTYLQAHGVYLTATTSVRVDGVLSSLRGRQTSNGEHELTIVLLDAGGRRVGEEAVSRTFFVHGVGT